MITRIILLLLMLMSCGVVRAQEETSRLNGWGVPNEPQNCEMNLQDLEHARNLARRETNGFLIIMARLGDGERRRELNYRRLHNVRLQLTNISFPADKIVAAEGERVSGLGRVEFYVRGEFIGALPVRRGADICVGCCGPDENFYPYRRDNRRNAAGGAQPNKGMNRTRN
ncbi:MAG: hypothetical protein LC800_14600 [Acidobacteria bacterium]|nr:hypothetical protein [Acidobacteriota bacterium]